MLGVDPEDNAWGPAIDEGLRSFARPPDWLLALDDGARVAAALARWVPELSSGRERIVGCDVRRVRLRGRQWLGQYELEIERGGRRRTIELLAQLVVDEGDAPPAGVDGHELGAEGWTCFAPELRLHFRAQPPDSALASLPALTDPDAAKPLLERALRSASATYADLRIEACTPRVMRYKPGRRCTVLYHLDYPAEMRERGWPNPVVAKTHIGAKGRNAHESMSALWHSPLRHSVNVAVAEPLGFLPEENIVLQGPIREERTLKQQLRRAVADGSEDALTELRGYLRATARGLADLHGCGVTAGTSWTFEDEARDVRGRVERLAEFAPELSGAADPIFDRLGEMAAASPPDGLVPSHRSFRPAQVLIHGQDIGFIDFDSFCQAEPALDLSLFTSVLRDLTIRALRARDGRGAPGEPVRGDHLALLDDLSDTFLACYQRSVSVGVSPGRVRLWQVLLAFDRVVTCWTKDRFERLPHCMSLLTHLLAKGDATKLVA